MHVASQEVAMGKAQFVYVTYIASSPDKVWQAILEPKTTAKYWQHENLSDWRVGSRWKQRSATEDRTLHMVGKILEFSPPRRLVMTWADPEQEASDEKHSRVTFAIDPYRDGTRLVVTHDQLEPGSEMEQGISDGWPMVLSSLRSLLETGRALPNQHARRGERDKPTRVHAKQ
jgi:uncharacterized protein YndB with AHSA1/START domain